MKSFVLARLAERDIGEIWDYIAEDDIEAADRVARALEEAMHRLAEPPALVTCAKIWRTSLTGSG